MGTCGISSASYNWSRVASALGSLSQYLVGSSANTWHLLVGDDFHLDASGREYRTALLCFFVLCDICRIPLTWNKTAGGDTVAWVELLHASSELGISQRRAEGFIKWTTEIANSTYMNMSRYEEGKPFLGPLCRFLSLHPRVSVRRVPPYVSFTLSHLSRQVAQCRHFPCTAPNLDPQASAERTGRGGWLPALGIDGNPSLASSFWLSHEITRAEFPLSLNDAEIRRY